MSESADPDFSWLTFFKNAGIPDDDATEYVERFEDNRIKKNMLLELNKDILQDIGIGMAGDIIAILRHAKIVHAQEIRKNSVTKTKVTTVGSSSAPKVTSKRSAISEINEWIKVPGKTQLVKKEAYETKQYSDNSRGVTKVSLRSSPELSSGLGLGQWGLNVSKKKRTKMDTGSSPPPERYEKTGEDYVTRKRPSNDNFSEGQQPPASKRLQPPTSQEIVQQHEDKSSLSLKDNTDPIDTHHSVFERLDHSRSEQKTSASVQKVTASSNTNTKQNFEEQLHQVALSVVMECLQDKQQKPSSVSKNTLVSRRSQPEIRQTERTSVAGKTNTFDRLTQINTMREPVKLPESNGSTRTGTSLGNVPRKLKLRMDSVDDPATSKQGVMSRLGKQSAFTKPAVKQSVFNRLNN